MPHLQNHKIKRVDIHVHVKTAPSCGKCNAVVVIVPRLADQQSTEAPPPPTQASKNHQQPENPSSKVEYRSWKEGG